MINAVDLLNLIGFRCRAGDESGARGHVLERDRVILGMNVCFHNWIGLPPRFRRGGTGKMQDFSHVSSCYLECLEKNAFSSSYHHRSSLMRLWWRHTAHPWFPWDGVRVFRHNRETFPPDPAGWFPVGR